MRGQGGPGSGTAERALGELYHACYRRLVAQVYAFTTDLTEAQDVVQEAFARALARPRGLTDVDSPEAWLRTVAVNVVRRRWRRRKLLDAILLRDRPVARVVAPEPGPERADVRDALAAIPALFREVVVLHYFADLPVDEVATVLGVPVGTVKSRLSRARTALAGQLDGYGAEPGGRRPDRGPDGPSAAAPAVGRTDAPADRVDGRATGPGRLARALGTAEVAHA